MDCFGEEPMNIYPSTQRASQLNTAEVERKTAAPFNRSRRVVKRRSVEYVHVQDRMNAQPKGKKEHASRAAVRPYTHHNATYPK